LDIVAADAVVRLYRNYDPALDNGPVQMVSAFRSLNELVQVKQGNGLILDWKQSSGTLLVGGDSRIIRVWDAHAETQSMVDMRFLAFYFRHC
jgi:regulatory associated protein of mTOR